MSGHGTGVEPDWRRVARVTASATGPRPWLWPTTAVQALRLARPGWWRRWPPLPLPDSELWRFRVETAYGGAGDAVPEAGDVRSFLQWCQGMARWRRR